MKHRAIAAVQQMDSEIATLLQQRLDEANIQINSYHEDVYEIDTKDVGNFNNIYTEVVRQVVRNSTNPSTTK